MGTEAERTQTIDLATLGIQPVDLSQLEVPFTEDEVSAAITALPKDKAPGPDGFTTEFYRAAWHIIKADLLAALNTFNRADRRGFSGINNVLLTLLPKKNVVEEAGDYRPIYLIHSFAKLLTKNDGPETFPENGYAQSAFIQNRSIHDYFMLVHATARLFKQRKIPKLLLKLDIAKAFDTVVWPFLLQVLEARGFRPR